MKRLLALAGATLFFPAVFIRCGRTEESSPDKKAPADARAQPHRNRPNRTERPGTRPRPRPRPRVETPGPRRFNGIPETEILRRIKKEHIRHIAFNRAGSSLSFRFWLADGSSAAFKPQQIHDQSRPRKEIAAYRVNCALGLHRVPPATWRSISKESFLRLIVSSDRSLIPRIHKEARTWYGILRGQVSWWIPKIVYLPMNSYRARKEREQMLTVGTTIRPDKAHLAPQISTMIVFDYIINNVDRFTGGNTMSTPDRKFLYLMDNTYSFFPTPRRNNGVLKRLKRTQRFSRRLYRALKALTLRRLEAELGKEKRTVLYKKERLAVIQRRDRAVRHVEEMMGRYGRKEVLCFP